MPFIDDHETDGFSFIWTIQNFSYCLRDPMEILDSPIFVLDTIGPDRWRLKVCREWPIDTKTVSFRLQKISNSKRLVEFALSILTTSGSFKKIGNLVFEFHSITILGHPDFLKLEQLRENGSDTFLDNDTMTLRCRIWKVDSKSIATTRCYARTIINVERTINIWSLENFRTNKSAEMQLCLTLEMQSCIAVKLRSRKETFYGGRVTLEVKQIDKYKQCYFTCDLSLVDTDEKVVHFVREEHRFGYSQVVQVWTLPYIPPIRLCDYKNTYLRCELAVSCGMKHSWVERVESGKIDSLQPNNSSLKNEKDFSDSLKSDLQRYYSDGMFADFTIRTPSKEFPVHKAFLCARSAVFRSMFEQDMEDNRTGVANVEDVDTDTVHKMLLFVYSDVAEDLDCDSASKLYFAADKYRITALRRRCSDFLKDNLSASNVCEVTALANLHQDEDLKSFAQDFIMKHAAEVMITGEWTKFKQDHVHLHSETMDALFMRNLNFPNRN